MNASISDASYACLLAEVDPNDDQDVNDVFLLLDGL